MNELEGRRGRPGSSMGGSGGVGSNARVGGSVGWFESRHVVVFDGVRLLGTFGERPRE